jgi:multiple sugar transport system ATP-binding protein/alpha-glucoside transport system ATP-binding protein
VATVELKNVTKIYEGGVKAVDNANITINDKEFVVLVGPSGCGKSTTLRMVAGLEEITSGELYIDGKLMNDVAPKDRDIAMVFQNYALYPHMTVYENMAFGLKIRKFPKPEINQRVHDAAAILDIEELLDRKPKALSGGQRQRVAVGRAIVRKPKVFLFDEPLSNLDAALRVATRIEIAKLNESMPDTTMIYVTHDQVEAMTLADRIVVLRDGYIEQVGSPMDLYHNPDNLFVAQFIGSPAMNILEATVKSASGSAIEVDVAHAGTATVPHGGDAGLKGQAVSLGVRPEDLKLTDDASNALISGIVDIVEALGEVTLLYVQMEGHDEPYIAKLTGDVKIERGAQIHLSAAPEVLHLFDKDGKSLTADHKRAAA